MVQLASVKKFWQLSPGYTDLTWPAVRALRKQARSQILEAGETQLGKPGIAIFQPASTQYKSAALGSGVLLILF